ncbi:hypothetical protein M433DRAFT_9725 [Acidomyces richmondensis BFW]|nr:hypothetical protein M433DRAFT_9725 [Acidomyces richmondensis BFW]
MPMLSTLCELSLEQPDHYLDKMAVFLWDEFDTKLDPSQQPGLLIKGWSQPKQKRSKTKLAPRLWIEAGLAKRVVRDMRGQAPSCSL